MICVEKPVRSIRLGNNGQADRRCDNCLADCALAPLPCIACRRVSYCSQACHQQSRDYHSAECGVTEHLSQLLHASNMPDAMPDYFRLGLRVVAGAIHDGSLHTAIQDKVLPDQQLDDTGLSQILLETTQQRPQSFASLLNLCGWQVEPDLQRDFWLYVVVVLYLGEVYAYVRMRMDICDL